MNEKKPVSQDPSTPAKKSAEPPKVKRPIDPQRVKKSVPSQPKQPADLYFLQETEEPQALHRTAEGKTTKKTVETKRLKKRTELDTEVRRPKSKAKSLDTARKKSSKKELGGLPSAREDAIMSILGGGAIGLVIGLIHFFTGFGIRLFRWYDIENPFLFPGESILFLVCLFAFFGYVTTKTTRV